MDKGGESMSMDFTWHTRDADDAQDSLVSTSNPDEAGVEKEPEEDAGVRSRAAMADISVSGGWRSSDTYGSETAQGTRQEDEALLGMREALMTRRGGWLVKRARQRGSARGGGGWVSDK